MMNRISLLWVVTCVVFLCSAVASAAKLDTNTKQTSNSIKKIEILTVERLLNSSMRIQEQSTLVKRKKVGIEAETFFRKIGIKSDKMIIALLTNAWHESSWVPEAKSGPNIGFFQLNRAGGMGAGHSEANLKKLYYNMYTMSVSTSFKAWTAWCKKNPNVNCGEMAYRFARDVERCLSKHWQPRRRTADRWYKALTA